MQSVLQTSLAGGNAAYPLDGSVITLTGLTVVDDGPFSTVVSAANNNARGIDNNLEGIYLDDFIIGFGERGETVIDPTSDTTFVLNPNRILNSINVGPYQLEIRGGEEYLAPSRASGSYIDGFAVNERLSTGTTLRLTSSDNLVNGDYIDISDGIRTVRFVFQDTRVSGNTLAANEVSVPFTSSVIDTVTRITAPNRHPSSLADCGI